MTLSRRNARPSTFSQNFRRRSRLFWRLFTDNSAWIVLALTLITSVSAFWGTAVAMRKTPVEAEPVSFWNWFTDAVYETAQVLALNMDSHAGEFNFGIGLARMGAVLLAIVVAIEAIRRLFKNSFENLRLRVWGNRHVFIAGLGRIGLEVAHSRVAKNDFVVAFEIVDANRWSAQAEEIGVLVKHGDVNHSEMLESVVAKNPREYFLVTGDDQTNLNALARIRELRTEFKSKHASVKDASDCYIHIDDAVLHNALCRSQAEEQQTGGSKDDLAVHYFNICHETACELVVRDLTQYRPTQIDEVALYIVFGFEQMGQAMVKELVEFAHFENQLRSRILVLTQTPEEDADRCLARWPRMSPRFVHDDLSNVVFAPACDRWTDRSVRVSKEYQVDDEVAVEYAANVHFCKLTSPHAMTQTDVASIVRLATEKGVCPVVLFCYEDDDTNFKMANEFNDILCDFHGINRVQALGSVTSGENRTIPCRVFMPRSQSLRDVLRNSSEARFLYPFGAVSEGIRRAQDELVEELGMVFAWAYERHMALAKAEQANDQARITVISHELYNRQQFLQKWQSKPHWDRYSNCAAAEHAWIKLQIIGVQLHDLIQGDPRIACVLTHFSQEKKALLAYIEHNRWLAERLLMGWSYGTRSDTPPRRPSICAKGPLSQEELEKDVAQIRAMCDYLIGRRKS